MTTSIRLINLFCFRKHQRFICWTISGRISRQLEEFGIKSLNLLSILEKLQGEICEENFVQNCWKIETKWKMKRFDFWKRIFLICWIFLDWFNFDRCFFQEVIKFPSKCLATIKFSKKIERKLRKIAKSWSRNDLCNVLSRCLSSVFID